MAQQPIYLPDVELHGKPGAWTDSIRRMQEAGKEYPKIWHLFAFRPDATDHLARFTQEIMRGPAPVTPGMRELIAAFTSFGNDCQYCGRSHAAIAAEMLGDADLVAGVLRDLETSRLDEKDKALLRFAAKVNHSHSHIDLADMQPLREAGWDDEAIYYTITVCALFNFYNRWIHGAGVRPLSEEGHRESGKRTAEFGYVRK